MMDRSVFNCIDCSVVRYLCENYGKRTITAPHDYPWRVNYEPGAKGSFQYMWGICVPYNMLDEAHVQLYRDHGIAIVCTPADTPEQVKKAVSLGVTLPLCNDPRCFLQSRDNSTADN